MSSVCKSCGSSELASENCESICTNCGEVQDSAGDNRLCMLPDNDAIVDNMRNKNYDSNERLTGRIRGETTSSVARKQICRERIYEDMLKVVKQLVKDPNATDETMDLVKSTLQAYKGRLMTSKKLGLVGACIYYLSAKHQLGITLNDICKVLNVKMKIMSACLKQVRELCPEFGYERPNIRDLVKKFINDMATKRYEIITETSHNPSDQATYETRPLIDNKDRVVLQNRVMLLIDLFEAMHPYNQPTPQSLITAVIYHAWRSLDTFKLIALNLNSGIESISNQESSGEAPLMIDEPPTRNSLIVKHSVSFEKFCQICNKKYSSNGYKIVNKLQSSLLMLGKYLGDVNKLNLPWYLKDIIENSPHLIQEHMRAEPIQTSRD